MNAADLPFAATSYRLAADVEVRALRENEARIVAARLADLVPWRSLGYTTAGLERYLTRHDPSLSRYALWCADRLSGVVAVRAPWLRGAYLELLAVFEETQGQGLGQKIMTWLLAEGGRAGANLWAAVSTTNERARRFYARHGFVAVGELPDLVRVGYTEILLRRPLTRHVAHDLPCHGRAGMDNAPPAPDTDLSRKLHGDHTMSDHPITSFPGDQIDVHFDRRLCIGVGECGRSSGPLFEAGRTPWCDPNQTSVAETRAIVERCPTGALTYTDKSGAPELPPAENIITIVSDGPLYATGTLAIGNAPDDLPGVRTRAALCRCGHSGNKPFCDNSHRAADFRDYGAVGDTGPGTSATGGPLAIKAIPGGPLLVKGAFALRAASATLPNRQNPIARSGRA